MNGTAWTDAGQGDNLRTLLGAFIGAGAALELAQGDLVRRIDGTRNFCKRTNLRLTGDPVTAYDLERIASCKVSR